MDTTTTTTAAATEDAVVDGPDTDAVTDNLATWYGGTRTTADPWRHGSHSGCSEAWERQRTGRGYT
jgi:hypothetical protein